MVYGQVRLRRGEDRGVNAGLCWIYDNQVAWVDEDCRNGGVADVTNAEGRFLGRGFFNGDSKIVVRLLSRAKIEVDAALIRGRIQAAWNRRQALGFENACRVVFGDADGLPGLTVDKFGDYLSFQIVCLGMAAFQDTIIESLTSIFHPKGICQRNDVAIREKEGLPLEAGCVYGALPARVQFLEHAALYGAAAVKSVDVSAEALEMLVDNARLNGVADRITTVQANVFDLVKAESDAGQTYGLVICDPPAFSKSRKTLDAAYRGYKELNLRCMKMVEPGGYLASFSCSQFMTAPLFLQMLREAAADAGRDAQILEALLQSRDHPATLSSETSSYLKGYILQIM